MSVAFSEYAPDQSATKEEWSSGSVSVEFRPLLPFWWGSHSSVLARCTAAEVNKTPWVVLKRSHHNAKAVQMITTRMQKEFVLFDAAVWLGGDDSSRFIRPAVVYFCLRVHSYSTAATHRQHQTSRSWVLEVLAAVTV
eukprot:11459-Heterococcus_DN1.PRE.1